MNADFTEAVLLGADLDHADLEGAHLWGADVRVRPNVTNLAASKAHCWSAKTRWFEGLAVKPEIKPHHSEKEAGR